MLQLALATAKARTNFAQGIILERCALTGMLKVAKFRIGIYRKSSRSRKENCNAFR